MAGVSGETAGGAPAPPPAAVSFFGDRLDVVRRYADLLAGPGTARGLLGPREVPRLWERHLLNCAVVQEALPRAASVVDVGSGAGLPGLVLALARPDLSLTLLEPLLRRSKFLDEVLDELALSNASVVRARAEDLHGRLFADAVTARAVAPLDRLARWTLPLLRPGGVLVALKGRSVDDELAANGSRLEALGASSWQVGRYGVGVVDPPSRAAVVVAGPLAGGGKQGVEARRRKR